MINIQNINRKKTYPKSKYRNIRKELVDREDLNYINGIIRNEKKYKKKSPQSETSNINDLKHFDSGTDLEDDLY